MGTVQRLSPGVDQIVLLTKKFVPNVMFVLHTFLCMRIDVLLVFDWEYIAARIFLGRVASELADWYGRARRCGLVDVHVFRFVDCTIGGLILGTFAHMLVECPLAVGGTVRFG